MRSHASHLCMALLTTTVLLTGCSSRVPQAVTTASIAHQSPAAVNLTATTAGYKAFVKDEEFQKAIADSIANTKVFTSVSADAKASLSVTLQIWESDAIGFSMDGKSTSLWIVTYDGKTLTQVIEGKSSKGITDAFFGENRTRLAARAALEDGILHGLEWVATLDIPNK